MHNLRKLLVYQKSITLTILLRKTTLGFPRDELFGLASQLRRAGHSIPLNVAEGAGRRTAKDFSRFLDQAIAAGYECLACFDIGRANEFIDSDAYKKLNATVDEIIAMLVGLQKSLHRKRSPSDD